MSRSMEPLFELYIFETTRLLEQLERCMLDCDQAKIIDCNTINDAYRILHTIKGAATMMLYTSISTVAHYLEELFYYLREEKKEVPNYIKIVDIVFHISDFIKNELAKIEDNIEPTGNPEQFIIIVNGILNELKSKVKSESNVQTISDDVRINKKKLDKLMDLMDEMDTAQRKVIKNPDIIGLKLDNFNNAARQLHKISNEIRDLISSIPFSVPVEPSK